ncbi:MAG: AraC family transcriptional regulator [Methylococcaceae bacterium]|jgi:AraC-like DNA-binding protein
MKKTTPTNATRWRIKSDEIPFEYLAQENQFYQRLPQEAGIGYSNIFHLEEGLHYIETLYTPQRDFSVLSTIECNEPQIIITLGLNGSSRFSGLGQDLIFKPGHSAITAFTSSQGERQYEANNAIKQVRLVIRKKWLELNLGPTTFDPWFKQNRLQAISCQPISHQSLLIIKELLNRDISAAMQRVFMQGYVRLLLASELSQLNFNSAETRKHVNHKDSEIAVKARDILAEEFNHPPSIAELSKRVGTNQLKLKQLFHHYFNNTPYGLLFEIRMSQAYQLLKTTHCHVNIAADYVGYQHASNFSAAFTKHFGMSPKTVSKS